MHRRARPGWSPLERATRAVGLYVLAPLLLLLTIPKAGELAAGPWTGFRVRNLLVASVDPDGPAARAGLLAGDRLLAVGGQPLATMVDWFVQTDAHQAPGPLRLLVRRGDAALSVTVSPTSPPHARVIWASSQYLSGLAFLMIGWWVLWRRRDPVARDFFGLCVIFAVLLMEIWVPPSRDWIIGRESVQDLLQLLLPPLFLRFFLSFPAQGDLPTERLARRRALLLPVIPLFLLSLYAQAARLDPRDSALVMFVQGAAFLYLFACFVAGLVIFARKALRRDRPVQQTKLRVVLLGLTAGLLPFLAGTVLGSFFPHVILPHREWLGFSLGLVPLTFGLAILRYGALDAEYVVRHGLTYAVLTLLLLMVYFVVVGLLGHLLTSTFHVSAYPLTLTLVAVSALAVTPARRMVQRWIDRAFYPARQSGRAAVAELGRELNGLIDTAEAAQLLTRRLSQLFGPQRTSLLLAAAPGDEMAEIAGWDGGHPVRPVYRLPLEGPLARTLYESRRPVFAEELEDTAALAEDAPTRELLARLGGELFIPLVTSNRLTGLLVLGPQRDGSLYTQDDIGNLQLLAMHAAAQLENTRLYQESLARQRFETELTVAQEIQARLVPAEALELPGLRLLGRMETSREVGGDYFDYFPLAGDRVGLAIADASGKGIPAALLMTQLRVVFRTEAARGVQPETVIGRLNDAACAPETSGHLISFFYGVYDVRAGRLQFCNAGMNPPLLFRQRGGRPEELRRGGPVLGAVPGRAYRQGTVRLDPGDLLLLFTDGLTEEINAAGEFFDLARLVQAVRENLSAPLEQLREEIFATVSAFGGTERADDRTLMLLQVNSL